MFRRLLSVGGFTLLSRITGFARDILMAWILGKGLMSDAFIVAFLFPSYFRSIFGEGGINPAFLPRYAALHAKGEHEAAAVFADRVFSWQMLAQLVILVAGMIFMPTIVRGIAPGFADNPGQLALTVELARITFPYLILTLVAIQLSAMLNAIEKFWAAAAWSNFQNLGMITTLIAWRWFPNAAYAAAWGLLLGGFAQLFFMLWAAKRDGVSLRISWPRWTPEIKEFFKALGAVTVGTASTLIAPLIDTVLASFLPTGSRTALYYADRINQLPLGVLGIALGTVLLPEMSARLARNDRDGSDAAQNNSAALTLLLTLPFAVVFFTIPGTIMRAIFAHGAFDAQAAALSGVALAAYGVGLPAFALVRIIASTFYARHDTATPARVTSHRLRREHRDEAGSGLGLSTRHRRDRARHRVRRLAQRRPTRLAGPKAFAPFDQRQLPPRTRPHLSLRGCGGRRRHCRCVGGRSSAHRGSVARLGGAGLRRAPRRTWIYRRRLCIPPLSAARPLRRESVSHAATLCGPLYSG